MSGFRGVPGWRKDLDDQTLADLIDADGRAMYARGDPVTLDRYLEAVSDLPERSVPLDAAVEAVLRSMSNSSVARRDDAEALAQQYPELYTNIMDAYMLSRVIATTETTRAVLGPTRRTLPGEFGPTTAEGESRFRLRELLGEGSFGQVYLADDRVLSDEEHVDQVAIKVSWGGATETRESSRTARAEASRARRIKHANVARLHDRGVTPEGEAYLVFEYVEGGTLNDWTERHGCPGGARAVASMMERVCRGVQAAHANGVIHHDLKPANILIDAEGEPKVTDFGISISTKAPAGADRPRGNLAFAAPEQVLGDLDAVSTATDVYSLGAMLFWLLVGELPHGTRKEAIERWHGQEVGARVGSLRQALAGVPRDLRMICCRAMAPKPEDRHASAAMMADDLRSWLEGRPIGWTNPSVVRRVWKWGRRRPVVAGVLVIGMLGLGIGGVLAYRGSIASVKLESDRKSRLEINQKMRKRYERIDFDAYETQALFFLWLLDSLNTEAIYGDASAGEFLWEKRLELGERALARSPSSSIDALLWQMQMALWLIQDPGYDSGTLALVEEAQESARRMLIEDDPWHADLALLASIARVEQALSGEPGVSLPVVARALDEEIARTTGRRLGTPLYEVALIWREKAGGPKADATSTSAADES